MAQQQHRPHRRGPALGDPGSVVWLQRALADALEEEEEEVEAQRADEQPLLSVHYLESVTTSPHSRLTPWMCRVR
eukprot:833132-Prymnesium_polylepis.1